jgi:hypothetical protein
MSVQLFGMAVRKYFTIDICRKSRYKDIISSRVLLNYLRMTSRKCNTIEHLLEIILLMNYSKKSSVQLLNVILKWYITFDGAENRNIYELLQIESYLTVRDDFEEIYYERTFVDNHIRDESI